MLCHWVRISMTISIEKPSSQCMNVYINSGIFCAVSFVLRTKFQNTVINVNFHQTSFGYDHNQVNKILHSSPGLNSNINFVSSWKCFSVFCLCVGNTVTFRTAFYKQLKQKKQLSVSIKTMNMKLKVLLKSWKF